MRPSGITINDIPYALADGEGSYEILEDPAVIQDPDIAGASRPSKTSRPDILTWKWDDWSGGEGTRFIDSSRPDTFKQYQDSSDAVNVLTPGELSIGLDLSQSQGLITGASPEATTRSFLAAAGGNVFAYHTDGSPEVVVFKYDFSTWSDPATTVDAGDSLNGPPAVSGAKMFVGTTSNMFKVATDLTVTAWGGGAASQSPIAADNRLYHFREGTDKIDLYQADLKAAGAGTLVGTANGVDKVIAATSNGQRVFLVAGRGTEQMKLFVWDGTALVEQGDLPQTFRTIDDRLDAARVAAGVLFMAGHTPGAAAGVLDAATLIFAEGANVDTVVSVKDLALRTAQARRFRCVTQANDNLLLLGGSDPDDADVFAYDISTGSLSLRARGDVTDSGLTSAEINSLVWEKGQLFAAVFADATANKTYVRYSLATGDDKYRSATAVAAPLWDFDLPNDEKILLDVELHFKALAAGEEVAFSFKADDGSEVTTDASAATMEATFAADGAVTRKSFTISGASVERTFRYLEPRLTLTAGTDAATTPTLYSASIRATTSGKAKFIRCEIDLGARVPHRTVSAAKAAAELEALVESSNRIVVIKPWYEKGGAPKPRSSDSYTVLIHQAALRWRSANSGRGALMFRVLA